MYNVIFEQAKDGQLTCKIDLKNGFKYVYSKYRPLNVDIVTNLQSEAESILLLGYGLGYEYEQYVATTNKEIFLVEGHEAFINHAFENGVTILSLQEAKSLIVKQNVQIIENKNVIECFPEYYEQLFENKNIHQREVVVFDYPVIARDCAEAFSNLGFHVRYITEEVFESFVGSISNMKPEFMFGINFQTHLADLAEQWGIPYIYWVVDTPNYNLFYETNKLRRYSTGFIYDRAVVEQLKGKGFSNIHYMPVAANIKRLSQVVLSNADLLKYSCDISFLGNTCVQNEFTKYIEPKIDEYSKTLINRLVAAQMYQEKFIIKETITNEIAETFFDISGISFKQDAFQGNFEMRDSMSMFLGRYHSYIERAKIANLLSFDFNLSIYGDRDWLNTLEKPAIYRGNAEHFIEMPKVFKASKINLNIIRSFVEAGLPMRVFDVLGSGGFLLTNSKRDIHEYFIDGKDLVVYRDEKDLIEIIQYYLVNEDKRLEIASNGFNKVKHEHTFEKRLQSILDISFL